MVILSPFVPNVSSDSSSDVYIGAPNVIGCLSDSTHECILPIDSALAHDWSFVAQNSPVQEDFTFHREIVDVSTGNTVNTDTTAITLSSNAVDSVHFTPWNGWLDGGSYNISFYATRPDNSNVGNLRYFHATFKEQIDVAILSDNSYRNSAIKNDLAILSMSYTQFEISDWDEYLRQGWLSHYSKVIMPWQSDSAAKPVSEGGSGYYELIGSNTNQNILKNYMSSGGTLQIHLSYSTEYYDYSSSTGESNLPLDMQIEPRLNENKITYNDIEFADPYHPIFENIDFASFQGFDAYGTVARSIINTNSATATSIPRACGGYSEQGGTFQRLIQSEENAADTLLGICSYGDGGMIVTTIDVEQHSEEADEEFTILGNMLSHQVTPYPNGFGTLGDGLDLTINGDVPIFDPFTGGYAYKYLKSNAEVTFGYHNSGHAESWHHDWEIQGPTDWEGNSMASGIDHTDETNPTATFCKVDVSHSTGCKQGVSWEITLYLHDNNGHSRTISVTVETDDTRADDYAPEAVAEIDMRPEYVDQIEYQGTKIVSGIDWPLNRLHLDETGSLTIHFDAGDSFDEDALTGNGINSYEWRVLFDKPYYEDNYKLEGHTFTTPESSDGKWAYTFSNVTVRPNGEIEGLIRIELTVIDHSGKWSDRYKMYFSVVPEGFGDGEPEIQIDLSLNGTLYYGDIITLSGIVLDGAENNDVYVEAALLESTLYGSPISKYTAQIEGEWDKSTALGDGDGFELTLQLSHDTNETSMRTQRIFLMSYEGDDKRWPTIYWIEITLEEPDQDGDGVVNSLDNCPQTISGYEVDSNGCAIDRDQDGITNSFDDCPDEFGTSNKGQHSNRLIGCQDSDGDGWADEIDAFSSNSSEWLDSDGDECGDNSDDLPQDPDDCIDTDGDGVGDNSDVFPEDANESKDSDLDGVGDNSDAFPDNPSETKDSDGNGVGDNYQKQLEDEIALNSRNNLILIGIISGIIIAIIAVVIYAKNRKKEINPKIDVFGNDLPQIVSSVPEGFSNQWTDESGYTWRLMDDGSTMWWNGTDWEKF